MTRMVPMLSADPFVRLSRLQSLRRRLLFRTAALLTMVSAAIALLPFRYAIRLGCVRLGRERTSEADCLWAIEAASRRLPWRTACIEKGLVGQRLLRRSGFEAVLHYGARQEAGKLDAHVWVMIDDRAIVGGHEAKEFAAIATYP